MWQQLSTGIAALMGVEFVLHILNVWHPQVTKRRIVARMVCDLTALGVIGFLVNANELVVTLPWPWATQHDFVNDVARIACFVWAAYLCWVCSRRRASVRARRPGASPGYATFADVVSGIRRSC